MFNFSFINKKNTFENIELDALLSQSITLSNRVSKHPLETGEMVTDAIHNEPIKISFSAVISDMPQNVVEQVATLTDTATSLLGGKSLGSSKSLKAWKDIYKLWRAKTLVTVSSPIQSDLFEDMAIRKITIAPEDTESLNFTVDLEELPIIENINNKNLADEVGKQSIRS